MPHDPDATVCPPGIAQGAFDLRNRGMDLQLEITVWPKRHHNRLTTGGEGPEQLRFMKYEEYLMCVCRFYEVYGQRVTKGGHVVRYPVEAEFENWVETWRKEARERSKGKR
jgi:hypothetical protein